MKSTSILASSWLALAVTAQADTFGSGGNQFTIDFVTVGNAGNADDAGDGGGQYSSPNGGVAYTFRMGIYEISQDMITRATNLGMANVAAGPWIGSQPATDMSWYEAAAFVNWLNTSTGHQAAYNLTYSGTWSMSLWGSVDAWQLGGANLYRHKDAYYFLPSEDEWYKAAYHKNDGVTANYWDYATGSNVPPTAVTSGTTAGTAVYNHVADSPAAVNNTGGLSAYGTRGQMGNVWEWMESPFRGEFYAGTSGGTELRAERGGAWVDGVLTLSSQIGGASTPTTFTGAGGLRVASVPEPSAAVLMLSGVGVWMLKRRRA